MRLNLWQLSCFCFVIAFTGCTYGHKAYRPNLPYSNTHELAVVEFNDQGEPWDPDQVRNAVRLVSEKSNQENTIVLIYVHGWHHNAKRNDSNLQGLGKTSSDLATNLAAEQYKEARRLLTDDSDVNIVGIYIGWRGKSLPMPLDYLTFWGRKNTAEVVGRNGLADLMRQLQSVYEERNTPARRKFMGMVSVGHSFGGQALFRATEQIIMEGLAQAPEAQVHGYGDLAVLINPALEALQFDRLHQVAIKKQYSCKQTPAMLVISGQGDTARQYWFPKGRWLTPNSTNEPLSLYALGEYEEHRTHSLQLTTKSDSFTVSEYQNHLAVMESDFTAPITMGGAELAPLLGTARVPYAPIVVAYTDEELIQGHNGIFTGAFHDFLLNYVAFLEGKIKMVRMGAPCPSPR